MNKNVCPNCGQLYDADLEKCPLCGTAAQVMESGSPFRKQRRAERKEAEQEARRQKNEAEAETEDDLLEEEAARKREEKRMKKAARRAARAEEDDEAEQSEAPTAVTPGVYQSGGRRPAVREEYIGRDRTRVPRVFLVLSFLLLLAALAIGGSYLLWKKNVVSLPVYDKLFDRYHSETAPADTPASGETGTVQTQAPADTDPVDPYSGANPCTGLSLNLTEITLTYRNDLDQIVASVEPRDTTDQRVYTSSDESVAKVTSVGVVTAVNPGTATITVTCGKQTASCTVICDFSDEPAPSESVSLNVDSLELNDKDMDMTFFHPGENFTLMVTNVPVGTPVTWTSQDPAIATVDEGGRVVAVAKGTTKVLAKVGDLTAECWVRCNFQEDEASGG